MTNSPPIVHVKPGECDNMVIDSMMIVIDPPGSQQNGICIHGGAKNLTISNCIIVGAGRMGIDVSAGANPGLKLINNIIHDCVPNPTGVNPPVIAPGMCSAIYTEGLTGALIKGNVAYNNGWWPNYDPNNAAHNTQAGKNHGHYSNESSGTDDTNTWDGNIFLDNLGSQIGSRLGGTFVNNIIRTTFDWGMVIGQYGKNAFVAGNAFFGALSNNPPYWGSGIHLNCPGYALGNYASGNSPIATNPFAMDMSGAVIPQIGYWHSPGATPLPTGVTLPTLEQYYGISNIYAKVQPGDAPKIISWLQKQLVTPPVAPPVPPPVMLGSGTTTAGQAFKVVAA